MTTEDPGRWERADRILSEALDLPPGERDAFVVRVAAGDASLLALLRRLLSGAEDGSGLLGPGGPWMPETIDAADGAPRDRTGETIGRYRILREIGRGGMAVVYLAERADGAFEHRVALKLVRRGIDTDDVVRRFAMERRILARFNHPNVARLLDGGTTDDGQPYFVLEHVDGFAIDRYCDEKALSIPDRLRIFLDVANAVADAHRNLVVHRDLKPSNVLVTRDGVVKLLDFGIAKVLGGEEGDEALTRTGVVPMTPAYASPEQLRGEPVTTASDIYQLGLLLRLLLTGRLPERARPSGALDRVFEPVTEELARARGCTAEELKRRLAGDLDTIVGTALHEDPERRYPSVAQLADDVLRYLEDRPVTARPDTLSYRASKFVRRHKVAVALAATSVWLLAALAVTMTYQAGRIARERDRANVQAETAARVKEFLIGLFEVADPSEARGTAITVREVLDRGARGLAAQLADQPEVRADLMDTVGRVYQNLGLYDAAAPLLRDALELRERTLPAGHPDVAASLNHLGWLLEQKGDYEGAEPLYRRALEACREAYGPEHVSVAAGINDLGLIRYRKGDHAGAEPLFREALAMYRRLDAARTPDAADATSNLGLALHRAGKLDEAEAAHREALELRREAVGTVHPAVAISLDNLGRIAFSRGDLAGAEARFREALEIRRRLYGGEHPQVSESLNNLASVLFRKGDLAGAEASFREVVAADRKLLGDDHPDLGQSLNNLAMILEKGGRAAEAEPVYAESVAILDRALGAGHWLSALTRGNRGACLAKLGRTAEAEPLLLSAHGGLAEALGPDNERTRAVAARLVELYQAQGRRADAGRWGELAAAPSGRRGPDEAVAGE